MVLKYNTIITCGTGENDLKKLFQGVCTVWKVTGAIYV